MALPESDRLEFAVMDLLWSYGRAASAQQIFDSLRGMRPVTYSLVRRTLRRLHRSGWVHRGALDGVQVYEPRAPRHVYEAQLIRDISESRPGHAAAFAHILPRPPFPGVIRSRPTAATG